jgi:hypothetical protein
MAFIILLLNFGAPIVGFIWLIVLHDWLRLVLGIAFVIASNFILGWLSLPQRIIGAILLGKDIRNKMPATIGASILNALTISIYGSFAIWVLCNNREGTRIIPYLLLSFSVVTAALSDKKIIENEYATGIVISNYIAAVISLVTLYFIAPNVGIALLIYAGLNFIGSIIWGTIVSRSL